MYTLQKTQEIVNQLFEEINWNEEPIGLYAPIGYVLALGGKRIRPTLTILAANIFTDDIQSVTNAAIGLEVFHNFTLLHDDIMDKAPVRRKQPTVHVKWDENTAILSGDAMLIKAYQYIARIPEAKLSEGLALFSKTALEVCEGQQYDMEFESQKTVAEGEYLEMIRLKTAVLLAACLKMGAIIGGATADDAQHLYDFGINIGLAFQLKDDLLDVYGDPETFGKQIGGDILCNKKTYLLIKALENANKKQKEELEYWFSQEKTENEQTKIQAVTELFNQTGTKMICEKKMDDYFAKAMNDLAKINVADEKKQELLQLAKKLMYREI